MKRRTFLGGMVVAAVGAVLPAPRRNDWDIYCGECGLRFGHLENVEIGEINYFHKYKSGKHRIVKGALSTECCDGAIMGRNMLTGEVVRGC